MSYTYHQYYKTCNDCCANLDHGESCDCKVVGIDLAYGKDMTGCSPLLNKHGEYVLKFANNHGMSIAEAHKALMVKAHLEYCNQAGLLMEA